jgi:glycerol-3-phosphate dehydrogenase (NAD(P)+)
MKVTVLGCGRWGSFQAWYASGIGHDVMLWGRSGSENFRVLAETRANEYLTLSEKIILSSDLEECVSYGDVLIISIQSTGLREFARSLSKFDLKAKKIVICMKGLEQDTGKRLTEVVSEETGCSDNVAVWVGPGHVQDFVAGIPNCMVIDSVNPGLTKEIAESFGSDLIRMYYGQDLIGNEIGAAAKNVIGIAAGMLDGFHYGSLKGALMARGSREIARLIKAAGGSEITAYGLSHLGDYQATLFSEYGQNRMYGEAYIRGEKFEKLAEGVSTVKALMELSRKYDCEIPISEGIYEVLYNKKDPKEVLVGMFLRPKRSEFA